MTINDIVRLRIYAFCHGFSLHQFTLLTIIKETFLTSYEGVFLIIGIQTLSQIVSEAKSGYLAKKYGCWYVLKLCSIFRFAALSSLVLFFSLSPASPYIRNEMNFVWYIRLCLLTMWSVSEGIGSAMYSGADVSLVYDLTIHSAKSVNEKTRNFKVQENLSYQHMMWPMAMTISCMISSMECIKDNLYWLTLGSCIAVLFSGLTIFQCKDHKKSDKVISNSIDNKIKIESNDSNNSKHNNNSNNNMNNVKEVKMKMTWWEASMASVTKIMEHPETKPLLFYIIIVNLQTETLSKLRPFIFRKEYAHLISGVSFFGSMCGSWVASSCIDIFFDGRTNKIWTTMRDYLLIFSIVPLLWITIITDEMWPTKYSEYIRFIMMIVSTFCMSFGWGQHKSNFQRILFENMPLSWCKVEVLSAIKIATQIFHSLWMCCILSPLLDYNVCSIVHALLFSALVSGLCICKSYICL